MRPIGKAHWDVLSPMLDELLESDPERRAARLAEIRDRDEKLSDDLAAFLREHGAVEREAFLDGHAIDSRDATDLHGQIIGSYTLDRLLGHGGMGTVWLARRSDDRFEGQVAIKFLNLALLDRGAARFRREGNILARLTDARIARLLDAGITTSGQPYLVLEYVEGEPIDRWCDARRLDVPARIKLFLDVASAVIEAHRHLVLHRDLKPANILVTAAGEVKLLDFGIAKLLEENGPDQGAAALTMEGAQALTPHYASPEQLTGAPATTATDIHALGGLLYLLLTGCHPAGTASSPAALMRAVVDAEPKRASDAVRESGTNPDDMSTIAAARATTPDRLCRLLQGDLDTILAKALKRIPQERYASVTALADDLRRYVAHQPISARPDAWTYRAGKFLRRNWLPASAAALIVAALATGLYVVNRERAAAQRRFDQVRQLANKILTLDEVIRGLPGSTKARQEIVAMSSQYLQALSVEVGSDANLALEVGTAYSRLARAQGVPSAPNLGQVAQAEESLRKAETLLDTALVALPENRLALLTAAHVAHDRMILADVAQRDDDALRMAAGAAARLETFLQRVDASEPERREAAMVFGNIGLFHKNIHRFDDAIRYSRRAIDVAKPLPSAQMLVAQGLSVVADSLRLSGDLEGALRAITESVTTLERATALSEAARLSGFINVLSRQGVILGEDGGVNAGRPDEAIAVLQRTIALAEKWAAADPSETSSRIRLASAARELGNILRHRNPAAALLVYDHARRRIGEIKGNAVALRREAEVLAGSAYAARHLNRKADAHERIETALRLLRETKSYPADQISPGATADVVLRAQADHLADTGELPRAVQVYEELLGKLMASKPVPQNDLSHAASLSGIYDALIGLYRRTGLHEKAASQSGVRLALWQQWDRKLPGNPFVLGQLASIDAGKN
jgi:serine/threonine-protein kinase